ncbi:MAG: sigma-54-dependent Fis family transcriptional regulator [Deltaproteobacteria bacterium]|nr:sigma-54-dependent Fis family transcriptional regulator [Deltaproteobacteria bacterium]
MANEKIVIVDDEESMRDLLSIMLSKEGYDTVAFPSAEKALEYIEGSPVDLIISDLKMPGMGGVGLLKAVKELCPEVIFMIITAFASVDTAIDAMKSGAYDYFTKPFNIDDIKLHLKRALEWQRVKRENLILKKDQKTIFGLGGIIGTSAPMKEIYELVLSVSETKANVLISGESGTGKELIARAIHGESPRKDSSFVTINCGAVPENLLESELFGHQKGAFTGAVANKKGLAELANEGTLFLDEVTELPLNLQVKLLRFIQERNFRRVGGLTDISVDIRLVAATNKDVEKEVEAGRFREDLFYRLNVIRIKTPPLRDRKEDIPALVRYFLGKHCLEAGKEVKSVSEEVMAMFLDFGFKGNVRELENAIERGVALEKGDKLMPPCLPPEIREGFADGLGNGVGSRSVDFQGELSEAPPADFSEQGFNLESAVNNFEKKIIMTAMKKAGGVKKKAAEILGITFRSIRYKLEKYEDSDK